MYRLAEFSRKKYEQWLAKNKPKEYKTLLDIRKSLTEEALRYKRQGLVWDKQSTEHLDSGRELIRDTKAYSRDRDNLKDLQKQQNKMFEDIKRNDEKILKESQKRIDETIERIEEQQKNYKAKPKQKIKFDFEKDIDNIAAKLIKKNYKLSNIGKVGLGLGVVGLLGYGAIKVAQSRRRTKSGKIINVKGYSRNKKK